MLELIAKITRHSQLDENCFHNPHIMERNFIDDVGQFDLYCVNALKQSRKQVKTETTLFEIIETS